MARDPNRRRKEIAPAVLTRRSSVWSLWSVSSISSGTRQTRETGRQRDRPQYRFTGVELFVTEGEEGYLGGKTAEPSISSIEAVGSNRSILMPDPEFPTVLRPHRSFAARQTTQRPVTIQHDRLRRQKSKINEFGVLSATDCD